MEANELMIGDWVRITDSIDQNDAYWMHDDFHPGQAIRVEEILSYGVNPDWYDGEINDYIPEDAIEPIPLTPEILEKNGFIVKHPESTKRTYWKDRAGQIVGHKNRGLMYMEISGNPVKFGYFLPHFSGHIQYVHQLQHALRLCGIEKEIVL